MKELVDNIIECEIDNIPFNQIPLDERFGLIVHKNNVKYEFLIHLKSTSSNLVCFGSGAINGVDLERFKQKPRFNRQSWKINESTIYYNDPTRYINNQLLGGWGIGTPDEWYLETIKDIIVKIADFIEINHENILFYGSSLGGFMSIQLATLVKHSKALADVPQLTFENAKYYQHIKPIIFPNLSDDEIHEKFNHRLNVLELIKKEKYIPNAILIFDIGELDIAEHYVHFFNQLNKLNYCENTNRIKIIINPINEHKFLSMNESLEIIQQACDNNLLCFSDEVYNSKLYYSMKEYETKITLMEQEIENLKKDQTQKDAKIQELKHKYNIISNSKIWKTTKPLRKCLDLLK